MFDNIIGNPVKYLLLFLIASPGIAGPDAERIVARRATAMLPPDLRAFFESRASDLEERTLEPEAAWEIQTDKRGRQSWHHLRLDASASNGSTSARLAAAEAFPRKEADARKRFKDLGLSKEGGRLPWAVEELFADLTAAFTRGEADEILAAAGYLTHFAWDASVPFNATVHYDGRQTGNLNLGEIAVGQPYFAHQSVLHRIAGELVRRNRNRYLDGVRVQPMDLKPCTDPADAVFRQLTSALGRLEDMLTADRTIINQLGAKDGESFSEREDEYYQLLDAECGEVIVERMQAASVLAANLIAGAWEAAGRPALVASPPPASDPPPIQRAMAEEGKPASAKPPPAAASADGLVGSGKSPVYHRSSCEHAKKIAGSNLVHYASAQEAEGQGKRACRVCKPK